MDGDKKWLLLRGEGRREEQKNDSVVPSSIQLRGGIQRPSVVVYRAFN